MAGVRSGCKAVVQAQSPKAIYIHCAAHRLNLAVVSACKIQAFQNTESCMGEMARFFRMSAKRQRLLEKSCCYRSFGNVREEIERCMQNPLDSTH